MSYGMMALKIRWTDVARWPRSEIRFRVNDTGNPYPADRWTEANESILKVDNGIAISNTDEPGTWEDLTGLLVSSATSDSITQTPITFSVVKDEVMSDREFLRKTDRARPNPGGT